MANGICGLHAYIVSPTHASPSMPSLHRLQGAHRVRRCAYLCCCRIGRSVAPTRAVVVICVIAPELELNLEFIHSFCIYLPKSSPLSRSASSVHTPTYVRIRNRAKADRRYNKDILGGRDGSHHHCPRNQGSTAFVGRSHVARDPWTAAICQVPDVRGRPFL